MNTSYSEVKKAKDKAALALNLMTKKYGADPQSIDCEKMSNEDYLIYIELDDCIEQLKAIMCKLVPPRDLTGEGMTGEYGE